ncbi:hypothetical protein AX774_g2659 [Zancudomyces culisetae]|uniref:Uncharacterized protein n=1 Tax=Zancudomyces culisetae TaxID=1213189 RepID=A0A1R1PS95_ZANCU|nr:hypothetical protein AX774_g2659 [Zancudomyces culisetae]|eukprot:OMH83828.1 hypothetical protein AX774_g2659 [Zancudomyces culisetae]
MCVQHCVYCSICSPQTYAWECGRELARETSRQGGPFSTSTESGIRFLKKGEYLEIGPDRAISFFDSQF